MDEIKNCPKCGMELQVCENCENVICTDCDGYTITRDDVLLCAECSADILAEWNKQTESRPKVCGTCSHFKDEDVDGDGWCDKDDAIYHRSDYCGDHLPGQRPNNTKQE